MNKGRQPKKKNVSGEKDDYTNRGQIDRPSGKEEKEIQSAVKNRTNIPVTFNIRHFPYKYMPTFARC